MAKGMFLHTSAPYLFFPKNTSSFKVHYGCVEIHHDCSRKLWHWSSRAWWSDYGRHDVTTAVVGRLTLLIEGHHHITMVVMLTIVVSDVLQLWLSDRVFKSSGKSSNFHFFHNWATMLLQDKTSTQMWVLLRKCMQMAQKLTWNITTKLIYQPPHTW